jgi:hypothetical protein
MIHFKEWSKIKIYGYKRYFNIKTFTFSIVKSIIDFTINLLENIHDVFVLDITQCYENIPIEGKDNFIFATSFFVKNVFQQCHSQHPKSKYLLWSKIDLEKWTKGG